MTDMTELLDRLERAAMAYERLGKVTRDDEKSRQIRKDAIAELAAARKALADALASRPSLETGGVREALEPFALADLYQDSYPDKIEIECRIVGTSYRDILTVADFRRARSAYRAAPLVISTIAEEQDCRRRRRALADGGEAQ